MQLFKFSDSLLCQFNKSPNTMFVTGDGDKILYPIVIFNTVKMMYQKILREFFIMCLFPYQLMFPYINCLTIFSTNIYLSVTYPRFCIATSPIPVFIAMRKWLTVIAELSSKIMQLFTTFLTFSAFRLKHFNISLVTIYCSTGQTIFAITMRRIFCVTMIASFNNCHGYIVTQFFKKVQLENRYKTSYQNTGER
jgi:hypothetical protein